MIQAFRIRHKTLGYSTGGAPPKFTWREKQAKVWMSEEDVARHIKLLMREGMRELLDECLVEFCIVEERAKVPANEFIEAFNEKLARREAQKQERSRAYHAIRTGRIDLNRRNEPENVESIAAKMFRSILQSGV